MTLIDVGDGTATISNGVMTAGGTSPRIYYDGPWKNVEFEAEVKPVSNVSQTYLVGRSSHQDRPCGFGGYDYYIDITDKSAFFKKEIHHGTCPDDGLSGYSARSASVKIPVESGVWYKQKLRVTNVDNKVKLEAFFNGTKVTELIDDGTILCGDKKTPAITTEQKWCYTRANRDSDTQPLQIQYKNISIKSI